MAEPSVDCKVEDYIEFVIPPNTHGYSPKGGVARGVVKSRWERDGHRWIAVEVEGYGHSWGVRAEWVRQVLGPGTHGGEGATG